MRILISDKNASKISMLLVKLAMSQVTKHFRSYGSNLDQNNNHKNTNQITTMKDIQNTEQQTDDTQYDTSNVNIRENLDQLEGVVQYVLEEQEAYRERVTERKRKYPDACNAPDDDDFDAEYREQCYDHIMGRLHKLLGSWQPEPKRRIKNRPVFDIADDDLAGL